MVGEGGEARPPKNQARRFRGGPGSGVCDPDAVVTQRKRRERERGEGCLVSRPPGAGYAAAASILQ